MILYSNVPNKNKILKRSVSQDFLGTFLECTDRSRSLTVFNFFC
jgi:hypothetical protein